MENKLPVCHIMIRMLRIAIASEAMCPECGKDLDIGKVRDDDNKIESYINSLCVRCGYSCDVELEAIEDLLEDLDRS